MTQEARNKVKGKGKKNKRASHDAATPAAFMKFMMKGWKTQPRRKITRVEGWERYRKRRRALSRAFPGETLIIPTGHEKVRANDTNFHFRPGSDFYYLTGNKEPDCVLVLVPRGKSGHTHVLYVEPNPGRSDATFFTDRDKGELWVGPRLGVPESKARFAVDQCAALDDLPAFLKKSGRKRFRVVRGLSARVDRALRNQKKRDGRLASFLSEQRLIKEPAEVTAILKAARATRRGFDDIVRALKSAKTERELEAAFNARARIEGNDVGYNVIAATGANACILHWTHNDAPIRKNDLVLIDAGVEGNELYTADVTRVLPKSGKFTAVQREVYDLVREAQKAAIAAVKPGNAFLAPHRAAMEVLAQGLIDMGILKMKLKEAMNPKKQFYRRYTLHGTSHMLGIDVHDAAHARQKRYRQGELEPGMVLTVEPGLYFQKDDLTVPGKYRGIGVRIEDDVLVTKTGRRVLTDVPRDSKDVEKWMRGLWGRRTMGS